MEFFIEGVCNNRDFLIKFHLFKGRGGYIFSLFNFRSVAALYSFKGQRLKLFLGFSNKVMCYTERIWLWESVFD